MLKTEFNKLDKFYKAEKDALIAAIRKERPDLKRKQFYQAANGNSCLTLMAGNEIFKSGKWSYWEDSIEIEGIILPMLENYSLPVPKITIVGKEYQFLGMTRMPGVTLSTVFNQLTQPERMDLAKDIAHFKQGLEEADFYEKLEDLDAMEKRTSSGRSFCYNAKKTLDFPGVKEILEKSELYEDLTHYLEGLAERDPVIIHGDLHNKNILVDPKTKKLSGIVDFGSIHATITPEHEFFSMRHLPKYGSNRRDKLYDADFVNLLQKEYCKASKLTVGQDRFRYALLYAIEQSSNNFEAPWVTPGGEDHELIMKKIQKIGPKILAK